VNRIDELFLELDEKECIDCKNTKIEKDLHHIENLVFAGIDAEKNQSPETKPEITQETKTATKLERKQNARNILIPKINNKFKLSKKRFALVLIAATLLLGMSALAARDNEWDIVILNYMGISDADTKQLEDGAVTIDATVKDNGITMKAVSSVGDKNSAYIRIDTDYKLPASFQKETDYIVPDDWSTRINKDAGTDTDHGSSLEYFDNGGYLSFMVYIGNCNGLNRKNVEIKMSDLYIYHDLNITTQSDRATEKSSKYLLLAGNWNLSWKYNYRANVKDYYLLRIVQSKNDICFVTKLEITPISISAQAIKNPMNGKTETSSLLISKITMKDGSIIEFDKKITTGGCRDNLFLEGYRNITELGKVIDPTQVYSVTIGDKEIIL